MALHHTQNDSYIHEMKKILFAYWNGNMLGHGQMAAQHTNSINAFPLL